MTDTNDLNAGFRRIGDDLAAYYVLGYYTTNTKFDGGLRKITVRLKGKPIRARRQYRAPTEDEIAAMARSGAASSRAAAAPVNAGPPAVIGEPVAYRVSRTQPPERAKAPEFVRSDRLRVEWPVLAPLDRREARMLDTAGKPMPFDVPVSESPDGKSVVVELALAPFGRGGYSLELTVRRQNGAAETHLHHEVRAVRVSAEPRGRLRSPSLRGSSNVFRRERPVAVSAPSDATPCGCESRRRRDS